MNLLLECKVHSSIIDYHCSTLNILRIKLTKLCHFCVAEPKNYIEIYRLVLVFVFQPFEILIYAENTVPNHLKIGQLGGVS